MDREEQIKNLTELLEPFHYESVVASGDIKSMAEKIYEVGYRLTPVLPEELREEVAKTIRDHGVFYVEFKPNKVKIERDIGRLTSELLSLFQSAQADVVRQRAELLKKAVELIKTWHNGEAVIKLGQEQADYMWDIYYNHAPEMKEIREALSEG